MAKEVKPADESKEGLTPVEGSTDTSAKVEDTSTKDADKAAPIAKAPEVKQEVTNSKASDKVASTSPEVTAPKPFDEVVLVDKNGVETITTQAFYEKQKDAFEMTGLKLKK